MFEIQVFHILQSEENKGTECPVLQRYVKECQTLPEAARRADGGINTHSPRLRLDEEL